jgi:hypothetical protein
MKVCMSPIETVRFPSLCLLAIFGSIFLSSALATKAFGDPLVTFTQQGTYCYFEYIEKPESGLEAAFKDFFSSETCAGNCGSMDVVVDPEENTIFWDWENCGQAIRTYDEVASQGVIPEANQGPTPCQY